MFGQKVWFTHFHADVGIVSAIERYGNEVKRIAGIIDAHLRKQKQDIGDNCGVWLVGNKCTYADLAFVPWNLELLHRQRLFPAGFDAEKEFPVFYQWYQNINKRPAVQKVIEMRDHCITTMQDSAAAVLPKGRHSRD